MSDSPTEPILGFRAWAVRYKVKKPKDKSFQAAVAMAARAQYMELFEQEAWMRERNLVFNNIQVVTARPRSIRTDLPILAPLHASADNTWDTAVAHFKCQHGHEKPVKECMCGLWFHNQIDRAVEEGGKIIGACICWGRVVLHGVEGFRAEHARIVAVSANHRGRSFSNTPGHEPPNTVKLARAVGERYGVACVPHTLLEKLGREHGKPIRWRYIWD